VNLGWGVVVVAVGGCNFRGHPRQAALPESRGPAPCPQAVRLRQAPTWATFYARFSSEEQLPSNSIELQSQSCLTTIRQHGWALAAEPAFIDRVRSGTTQAGRAVLFFATRPLTLKDVEVLHWVPYLERPEGQRERGERQCTQGARQLAQALNRMWPSHRWLSRRASRPARARHHH
jgi:hypothetical protein